MEPNEALVELKELSSQVEDAAILGESGFVLASTGTPERGEELAHAAAELLDGAGGLRSAGEVARVEVALPDGSIFVVREEGRVAVATTVSRPTAGLVVYDLRTALARLDEGKPKPKAARRRKTGAADA